MNIKTKGMALTVQLADYRSPWEGAKDFDAPWSFSIRILHWMLNLSKSAAPRKCSSG